MEAVELVVYLLVAVVVGVMMLQFLTSWDVTTFYDSVRRLMSREQKLEFQKVDREGFVATTYNFWDSCGFGEVEKSLSIYVEGTGLLTKAYLFNQTKKLNLCDSMQSATYGCGRLDNVVFRADIPLPHVVRLWCNTTSQKLRIEG